MHIKQNSGFTLAELMITVGILAFIIVSMINLYVFTSVQAEQASNKTHSIAEAQAKVEEIRNTDYDSIVANYAPGGTPGSAFTLSTITGAGNIGISTTTISNDTELLEITVSICWEDKYGRIVGEDADLDGVFEAGEDADSDGELDAPIVVKTYVTRR